MPRVDIVILNWRAWETTARCLDMLRPQLRGDTGVVVVDNASHDGSVEELRRRYPEVTVLEAATNAGFACGCNQGIQRARQYGADFVWLLNNDAEIQDRTLPALLVAVGDPQVGAAGSVQHDTRDRGDVLVWGGGYVNFLTGIPASCRRADQADGVRYLSAASVLLRMAALDEVGVLDEGYFMYWEDADLSFRLRAAGWKLAVAPDSVVYHRGFGSVDPRGATYDYHFTRSSIRFLRKHASFPPLPIAVSVGGRFVKRLAAGRGAGAAAVWRAAWGCDAATPEGGAA